MARAKLRRVELRPYQRDAIAAVLDARREGRTRLLVALPTGAGKTVIFAELIRRARHPVLVLAHRDELVVQARDKIAAALQHDGQAERVVAVEQGETRAPADASVVVASIRTLHEGRIGRALGGRNIRLVIYDECHHAVADANRRVLEQIGVFEPDWPGTLVGFTATTRRADGRALGEVFEHIAFDRSLRQMIDDGFLRPLRGLRFDTGVDLAGVALRGDDYDEVALAEAVDVQARNLLVARAIQECTRDRRTIAFCVGVGHALNLSRELRGVGVPAAMVCGETPRQERSEILERFRSGELRVITNVGVLTEGFDDPGVSAIAMVRPTRSESMYLQCVGRGMRLSPDAPDCLVLDFVDLSGIELITTPTLDAGASPSEVERPDAEPGTAAAPEPEQQDDVPATLAEIESRLAAFDPLTMVQREEAAAISLNAWLSLGARGMMLHFQDRAGELHCFELKPEGRQGAGVWLRGRKLARCSTMQEAIAAVDLELPRHGHPASAKPEARWRRAAVPDSLQAALDALRPPRVAHDVGTAIAHLALAQALGHRRVDV
ncbi:MAG: DEAD/DEAH box helicase [Myxococcota bacterium]